ncbi:MAG TPA: radical SAM protein, partial [Acidilobales archaeon]|nr:radical SAM protein [Acidilobales archaeon]
MGYDFILTTDRTMMSDHHGKEFIGFLATGPSYFLPESLWYYICCPKPKVDSEGKPVVAPYGLRKVEASLIDSGFKAAIIDPDYIERHVRGAKAVL